MNPRMTKKELNLLKGAIRRVFSRSDLRKEALKKARLEGYHDPLRPRVKKWGTCNICKLPIPEYLMQVDHFHPIVPITTSLEDMSIDDLVNNVWCDVKDLNSVCKLCHNIKTRFENKLRPKKKRKNLKHE